MRDAARLDRVRAPELRDSQTRAIDRVAVGSDVERQRGVNGSRALETLKRRFEGRWTSFRTMQVRAAAREELFFELSSVNTFKSSKSLQGTWRLPICFLRSRACVGFVTLFYKWNLSPRGAL